MNFSLVTTKKKKKLGGINFSYETFYFIYFIFLCFYKAIRHIYTFFSVGGYNISFFVFPYNHDTTLGVSEVEEKKIVIMVRTFLFKILLFSFYESFWFVIANNIPYKVYY